MSGRPTATVMIITYNHAPYIAEAINSVLNQVTTFPFAIHIIDDCSTDGAQDIIRDFAERYPGIVKPFINKVNIGSKVTQKNFYRGLKTLDGDYIAILEGDDYWVPTDRLQRHVEFLEANKDFVACANNTLKVYEDGSGTEPHLFQQPQSREVHDINDLIMISSFFHASSLTFRNVFRGRLPHYFRNPLSCDIFINIAHAQFGKIRFFQDVGSVYRAHGGGMFSQMNQTKGWMWNIDSLIAFNRWFGYRHFATFSRSIWNYCDLLLSQGKEENGLTPEKRRHYAAIRKRYRWMEKLYLRFDVGLSRLFPVRKARTAGAKLNFGSGRIKTLRMINVDKSRDYDPDMVVDLEKTPWPWPDNYAAEAWFEHALEHMGADYDVFQKMMKELYRVCKPDAKIFIRARHPWNSSFVHDPSCVRVISPSIMSLFDRSTPINAEPDPLARRVGVDFRMVASNAYLAEPYRSQYQNGQISGDQITNLLHTANNICEEFLIEMTVCKPARTDVVVAPAQPPAG